MLLLLAVKNHLNSMYYLQVTKNNYLRSLQKNKIEITILR